ncbi:MAG: sensor domain-containing diguanylate cyclase [Oscillospiraceae bacterium]|nr:sensor domain-containing diguanylate cyclase [Oscillospiraceae bacterium]
MTRQRPEKNNLQNVKRLKISLIIGYAVIVLVAVIAVSVLAVRKTDTVLKAKVISLTSSLNVQMKLNMNSYLSRMETIGTLAFTIEEAYTYDATDATNDEYEALGIEKIISDELYSLCIMENFVDYGIVYRNNHTIGKISNGTTNLFGDRLFTDLNAMISRKRTNDGWSAGYQDNFKRIYYVKKIHDNALLVISFYTSELESVFDNPETLSDMEIRLTDQNYHMIYSSRQNEVGSPLPDDIASRIQGQNSATVMDNAYLVSVNVCNDDWYVICSIPTQIILNEKNEMQLYIYIIACIAAVLAIATGAFLSIKLSDPVVDTVNILDTKAHIDQLTGIFNKRSFEEYTQTRLECSSPAERHALIIIDIDNFKGVNDTLGHSYGDAVLARVGGMMKEVFPEGDYLGRIGGDEFAVFMNTGNDNKPEYENYLASKCEALCESFRNHYTGADGNYKISASIGAVISPQYGKDFKELYTKADKALYFSKQSGKDRYTIYHDNLESEKQEETS